MLLKSEFLPLPRQCDGWLPGQIADMLACSHPSPQHNPGESSSIVILVVLELVLSRPFLRTLPQQQGCCAMASCVHVWLSITSLLLRRGCS